MREIIKTLPFLLLATAFSTAMAETQVTRGAGITVAVTVVEPEEATPDGTMTFRIDLDTHSGDLMLYDLTALATLRTNEGATLSDGFSWQGAGESSHHRSGYLQIDVTPLSPKSAEHLELEFRDIGTPSRVYRWQTADLPGPATGTERRPRYAFVPAIADATIVAIDLDANQAGWTLAVSEGSETRGAESAMGIAMSPDGEIVYTGDVATSEVVVVNVGRKEVAARIPVDHGIHAIDLSPDGRYLWVDGRLEDYSWLSATSIIDTESLAVTQTLSPGLGSAAHLTFTPDGGEVWAASVTTNLVWVWDAATAEVLAAVPLTQAPLEGATPEGQAGQLGFNEVAISPDGTRAYAVGPETSTVFAIDVATRQVVGNAQAGERAHGIAVTIDGAEVWTANRDGSVTIIDATTLEVVETLDVSPYANHVSFGADGGQAYVSRQDDVVVIDVASRELLAVIPIGSEPHEFSLKGQAASAQPPAAEE